MKTTSTEPSIQQMNETIARFEGWKRVYPGNAPKHGRALAQFEKDNGQSWHTYISDGIGEGVWPPYHTDYNHLHSAWVKLKELKIQEPFDQCTLNILRTSIGHRIAHGTHNEAHKALYDAITWFNNLKK